MLFSVIVPIYKIEKYLPRCIDSILAQSCADFELILVDDGSPDSCPAICDEYASRDDRIKVIHKANGGLVSARQAGIKIAVGDYVFHVDGDDALCDGALESAQKIINEFHPDIVSFSYKRYMDGVIGDIVDEIADEGFYGKSDIDDRIHPKLLSDTNMKNLFYYIWGKAIKRELATKHQLNVNPAISLGEDVCCSVPCYLDAESVYISRKPAYLYTIRNDSLTNDFKADQIIRIADVVQELWKMDVEKPQGFDDQVARYACFLCFAILALAAEGNHFGAIKKIKERVDNSVCGMEIRKARFENITIKSRIGIWLMKRRMIGAAFYFLWICKNIKRIKEGR